MNLDASSWQQCSNLAKRSTNVSQLKGERVKRAAAPSYFLQVAMKECTDTKPVLSPPAARNMGAFQYSGHPHA